MYKLLVLSVACVVASLSVLGQSKQSSVPSIYVDKSGVMRWSDSKAEASFYGVNYTAPFAHAYRALSTKGIDHKKAIDRDVYHFVRLGFNAYRIHIWDVEIADGQGNLLQNEHLDLLDYLFYKLEEKGIRSLITTMTNFGNGYPERNINTGAFSYLYDKCQVHADLQAIAAQKNYVTQLARHINPYTGKAYKDDPYIIGFEINNEPCHTGDVATTENYIKEMISAFDKTGNKKPLFYNVSHNMEHVPAYYQPEIQGTTYQWYPIGLVAGSQRKGNFLPYVDSYTIPFDQVRDFNKKVKAVYEYDPADILYSYIHPAMTRTFRSGGFQWITQFAYDPTDIAAYNTEYQTHYMNLAYTPAKALSLLISAEVAFRIPRNQRFASYPQDTVFGDFLVSYEQDLSMINSVDKYYYTNNTSVPPKSSSTLKHIAGHGSSPVVRYNGSGAYFLDQLEKGVWRLEVMPDAENVLDPFAKPSLSREVVKILWQERQFTLHLQDLGKGFNVSRLSDNQKETTQAADGLFAVTPGVYLLTNNAIEQMKWKSDSSWKNGALADFVAPPASKFDMPDVVHTAAKVLEKGKDASVAFDVVFDVKPDSVIVQTNKISFWSNHNPYIKLQPSGRYTYTATVPQSMLQGDAFSYTLTVFVGAKRYTYPDRKKGAPLDWDFDTEQYWSSELIAENSLLMLADATHDSPFEYYAIPDSSYIKYNSVAASYEGVGSWGYGFVVKNPETRFFWVKDIQQQVVERQSKLTAVKYLNIRLRAVNLQNNLQIGFVTNMGYTYTGKLQTAITDGQFEVVRVALDGLKNVPTAILPAPYPTFLERYFTPKKHIKFDIGDVEKLILSTEGVVPTDSKLEISALWLD